MLGLSNTQRELSIALLQLENSKLDKSSDEYRDLEARIRAAAAAKDTFAAGEQAKKAIADLAAEWDRTVGSISNSLTDALLRGFESGKDLAKNFADTLYNLFRTLVLRPTIQAIMAPIAGGITARLFSGAASAAGGSLFGSAAGSFLGGGLKSRSAAASREP